MASLYATTVCLLRLKQKKIRSSGWVKAVNMQWSQIKLHLLICRHVTLRRQTHHTEAVFSNDGQSQRGQSWESNIPRCRSNCGRNQHSVPLWLIYRTLLLTHPAKSFLKATHLQGRPQLAPSLSQSNSVRDKSGFLTRLIPMQLQLKSALFTLEDYKLSANC